MRNVMLALISCCAVAACSIPSKVSIDGGGHGTDGGAGTDGDTDGSVIDGNPGAPMITLTAQPPADGNQTSVTFTYSVTLSATVECRLDAQPYAACPPPSKTFTGLTDANHTFDLRATAAGVTASLPTITFKVDTKAPVLAFSSTPPSASSSTTAQFTFTIDDANMVTCQLDAQPAATCVTTATYNGLSDGSHTFTLKGTDPAGNTATKTYSWTVTTTGPTLTIMSAPANPTMATGAMFTFTVGTATTVTCQLDAQAAAACTTSASYTGLADGSHTFTLKGTDPAGNVSTTTYTWVVDTVAPQLTISSGPANPTMATSAMFAFNPGGAPIVTCQLDAASPTACTTSASYSGLAEGSHTFTLRATDAAGNMASKVYPWVIDLTPPTLTISMEPANPSMVATAAFAFSATGAATLTCQLDAQAATACTTSASYSGLADGSHTFTLKGTDNVGNVATKTYTWTVDTMPPTLAITMEPPNPSTSASAPFQFTTTGATTVTCQLDAQAPAACTTSVTYTGLADGSHTFKLSGTDDAGNTATKAYTWVVDTTPPAIAITSHPAANSNSTSASFGFTVDDSVTSSVTCQVDGANPQACGSPFTVSGLSNASHSFTVRGTDPAGNMGMASYTWNVDTVAPIVSIGTKPPSLTTSKTALFTFSTTEGSTACSFDLQPSTACTSGTTFGPFADGGHTLIVSATDAAGNYGSVGYSWTIDSTKPSVGGLSYTCDSTTGQLDVSWSASDATSGIVSGTCTYGSYGTFDCTNARAWSGSLSGSSTVFSLSYTDAAGNVGTAFVTVKLLACS